MLHIKLFRLVYCLFRFNRNIENLCFGIEAKKRNKRFVLDNAETSFGSSFGCFKLKLVSRDTQDVRKRVWCGPNLDCNKVIIVRQQAVQA
jgi:hypothetical protein